MMIRSDDDHCLAFTRPMPFARWIDEGHELGWPTLPDFEYHLTTLFPPVRPRGWFELRTLDALPDDWWPVAVAVTTALFDDPESADLASRETQLLRTRWVDAARDAGSDAVIGDVVARVLRGARSRRSLVSAPMPARSRLAERYYERFVACGRCPADDVLHDPRPLPATT